MIHKLYEYGNSEMYIHYALDKHPCVGDYSMHMHTMCEILGVIRGKGEYMIEGSLYRLEPGCIFVMRPSESHKLYIDESEVYERIVVNFFCNVIRSIDPNDLLLKPYLDRPLGRYNLYRNHEFSSPHGISYLRAMVAPAYTREEQRLNIVTNLLPLLNMLRPIFASKKSNDPGWICRDTPKLLVDYVNEHLHENLSLDLLSQQFFLSKSQISRVFKKATGSPILDYITIKRLLRADEYMAGGETATNACLLCGFCSYSSFYRAYIKHFGISPSDFRTKNL